MQRTQIYFPKDLHQDLLIAAKMNKLSLSAFIRKILGDCLYSPTNKPIKGMKVRRKANPLVIAKHAINLGPPDLAKNFDKYFEESLR